VVNKKEDFFMTMTIVKPMPTTNFTILPNQLLGYGRTNIKLKPRDSSVLNYLLSRPHTGWKLIATDIAKAVNVSVGTVYAALKVLQNEGLIRYNRDKNGYTFWRLEIPTEHPAKPVISPYTKKPCVENCDVLQIKDKIIKNKTTTSDIRTQPQKADETVVVPVSVIDVNESVPVVEQPIDNAKLSAVDSLDLPDVHKLAVRKSLQKSKIDPVIQEYVLIALKTALNGGNVRNPIAYLNGLVNAVFSGTFDTSAFKQYAKPVPREQVIRGLFEKHGEKIKQDIAKSGFINSEIGFIQFDEVRKLGLIEQSWVEKFNRYRLMEVSKKSNTQNQSNISAKGCTDLAKPDSPRLTPEQFEQLRQDKINQAMEIINEDKNGHRHI
jgi:DNA-binding transcriptional ArsR family regulator